ncbi:methylated-DNA--[protein]-cysteine S-methyltransferase [Oryzicola mucosus]|uniref:Methylated-DNA--[protein]-cysteine S-methyltransferase n=1 Tax=Oryzicola mucosus TaxID=2767425 RepID=A0A8J6U4M0_9HYPH|nr:methylated-DNA--[protein]-cysteine S-methyltransferase [Oryzicola mucosus]MBD0414595.1 methylated-DNA--[protein]-cysteine S-methyltransferase [Oryzicola mucosus]
MGVAWSEKGVRRFQLPDRDKDRTASQLASRLPTGLVSTAAAPDWIDRLIQDVKMYAEGAPIQFASVPVNLDGVDAFRLAVYARTRQLSYGETLSYGELAARSGYEGLAREVGQAMGSNPVPLIIPCHRVLAAGNRIGGFSAPGGSASKQRMLSLEGVRTGPPPPAQASFGF